MHTNIPVTLHDLYINHSLLDNVENPDTNTSSLSEGTGVAP